ncbi:MAG: hypothetical protein ABSG32_00090 [Terriglobia bacterium]
MNKPEITERNLGVEGRGTRPLFLVLWGGQSVHTEAAERVGQAGRQGQVAYRLGFIAKAGGRQPLVKMLKMKNGLDELLKAKEKEKCSG